ncbi:hypothetical protein D3C75_928860 [compost metagenome]
MRCLPGAVFKHAGKMKLTQFRLSGQIGQHQRLIEMVINKLLYPLKHGRCQPTTHARQPPLQLGVALKHMRHQQRGGAAQCQLVGGVLPIVIK